MTSVNQVTKKSYLLNTPIATKEQSFFGLLVTSCNSNSAPEHATDMIQKPADRALKDKDLHVPDFSISLSLLSYKRKCPCPNTKATTIYTMSNG